MKRKADVILSTSPVILSGGLSVNSAKDLEILRLRLRMTLFLSIFVFLSSLSAVFAWPTEDTAQFEKANAHYREGRFKEAAAFYEELARKNPSSATIQYNLGNSYYRTGSLGSAILAYERALLVEPRNGDIRQNLNFVRGLLEYRVDDKRNWYLRAAEKVLEYVTIDEVLFLGLVSFFLFALSWAFVLFFRQGLPWGTGRKALLFLSLLLGSLAAAKMVEAKVFRDGIVTAKNAEVRYGPSDSNRVAFRLGEGLKVYVMDQREDWNRILLVNGESGWIPKSQMAEIRT